MFTTEGLTAAYMLCAVLVIWFGWIKTVRPRWRKISRRVSGALDTLGGREAIIDAESGRELAPILLPLGERLGNIETALTRLADMHARLDNHEGRLESLELGRTERIVTKAESAAMWHAVANKDDITGEAES